MIRELKIVCTVKADQLMTASYIIKNKMRILVAEYQFVEVDANKPLKEGERHPVEMSLPFNARQPERRLFYEVGEDGQPLTPYDHQKAECIEKFYLEHPLTTINGALHSNTITGSPIYFDIIDVNMKIVSELKEWESKLKIGNYLREASLEAIRDVGFYYGISPVGKTKGAMCMQLADFNKGSLFVKDSSGKSFIDSFVKTFIDNQEPDKVIAINARKAVDFKIITSNVKEGRLFYYLGNELLGATFEDVVKWSKLNGEMYERYILKGIREKDQFSEETAGSEREKKNMIAPAETFMDKQKIQEDALALYEKLNLMVGHAEVVVTKAQIKSQGTAKLQESIVKMKEQLERLEKQPA